MKLTKKILAAIRPLKPREVARLGTLLYECTDGQGMEMEELDGFLSGLVAGPEVILPTEFYPRVFGGEMTEVVSFENKEQADELLGLMMRHFNSITTELSQNELHMPILALDQGGQIGGNEWARGFVKATQMRYDSWSEFVHNREHGPSMHPIFILYWEHGPMPNLRPCVPIGEEEREELVIGMATAALVAHKFFRGQRTAHAMMHRADYCRNPSQRAERGKTLVN